MSRQTSVPNSSLCLVFLFLLFFSISPVAAFGAGNIASISKIEGHNWRHGDIEDMLKTVAFIKGHKWTSMMIKRVYFGNWLRDYSQAVDVGTLKGVQAGTIRILVWVLSFLSFGYATGEFEVTEERLGVYRPEEHIDNPKDYADNVDARQYDQRLRPPILPIELQVDPKTGMKNYIANENLGIATSVGYVKHSFTRSVHFGRVYTSGASGTSGKEADLCEALRCLGQGLHCLEDFGAHTNYTELTLREMGFTNVFPHTGAATEINLHGHRVFPLVTGTFGAVDFLHSVLGEATDHFAQTEVDDMNKALGDAQAQSQHSSDGSRSFGSSSSQVSNLTGLLSQVPGAGGLCQQAEALQVQSNAEAQSSHLNRDAATGGFNLPTTFDGPPGSSTGPPGPSVPGMSPTFDPIATVAKIYPILEFRDRVVRLISSTIEKIPGLQPLVEKITETVTLFVLSLLAPYIRPIITAVSAQLKAGSTSVVDASGKHQFEVWEDPYCSDPTHSLLSKDHFSNILNEPAGQVAGAILQYVAPRIIYAWQNPSVPLDQVLNDIIRVFHHPAIRNPSCEIHQSMFAVVQRWVQSQPNRGSDLSSLLSSEGVRQGKNHIGLDEAGSQHNHGGLPGVGKIFGAGSHSKVSGAPWETLGAGREVGADETAQQIAGAWPGIETGYDSSSLVQGEYQAQTYGQSTYPTGQEGQEQSFHPYGLSSQSEQWSQTQGTGNAGGYSQPAEYPGHNYAGPGQDSQHAYPPQNFGQEGGYGGSLAGYNDDNLPAGQYGHGYGR